VIPLALPIHPLAANSIHVADMQKRGAKRKFLNIKI
jgi:hypothetical protein